MDTMSLRTMSFSDNERKTHIKLAEKLGLRMPMFYYKAISYFVKRKTTVHKASDEEKAIIRTMLDDDTLYLPLELEEHMRGQLDV